MTSRISTLLPAGLLAIFALWCGTFHGAASSAGAVSHQTLILLFCLLAPSLIDPLRLGVSGRLLLAAALVLVAISWWSSPVSRAGLVGITLLPAYLLLPSCAARCYGRDTSRRLALISLALVTLVVAGTALVQWQTLDLPRASLPLGHHNLLAGWLVLVLPPVAVTGLYSGFPRALALAAGMTGIVALAATGSLLGAAAITLQAVLAAVWWKRLRPLLLPGLLILGALAAPRMISVSQAIDLSSQARASYLAAGWRGIVMRPTLGWGPGAVPWTIGDHMRPREGIHPASQIVGDLHSTPLQITYETGVVGLLLALAISMVFLHRRFRETKSVPDSTVTRAALLGLLGGLLFSLGSAPLSVPALPVTAAVIAGLAMPVPELSPRRWRVLGLLTYGILGFFVLFPLNRAHRVYDQARLSATASESAANLRQALSSDPEFPLYQARAAWLASDGTGVSAQTAARALTAAESAPGLAPLWLAAGDLGRRAGMPWAPAALARAHRLDPLSPLTAFHLMMVEDVDSTAIQLGVASVLTEPVLANASWWTDHPEMAHTVGHISGVPIPTSPSSTTSTPMSLALTLDKTPSVSFSLFAFRRSPWPGRLAPIILVEH